MNSTSREEVWGKNYVLKSFISLWRFRTLIQNFLDHRTRKFWQGCRNCFLFVQRTIFSWVFLWKRKHSFLIFSDFEWFVSWFQLQFHSQPKKSDYEKLKLLSQFQFLNNFTHMCGELKVLWRKKLRSFVETALCVLRGTV